jgi:Cryptococcal mannosyltransferase 1
MTRCAGGSEAPLARCHRRPWGRAVPDSTPRVFMGGLLRDGEDSIEHVVSFIDAARRELPKLHAYVFENNSSDRTPELLADSATGRPHMSVRSESWDLDEFRERSKARTWDNKPCRIELVTEARNRLLDWMREADFTDGDRVVIVDWDFLKPPPLDPLVRHIREMVTGADAVFANGVDRTGRYYDLYALRTSEHPLGPEMLGDRFWSSRRRRRALARVIEPTELPIEVYSAFAGLAIYRAEALEGCRYSAYPTRELDAFYKERLSEYSHKGEVRRLRREKVERIHRGALLGAHLFDEELFYRNNSGFNFPITAEHVNLHLAMRARGHGRLLIVPDLPYYSHH